VNDDPAVNYLRETLALKPGFARQVSVGSLDVNSGDFWEFN
jgi:hypothetical protein